MGLKKRFISLVLAISIVLFAFPLTANEAAAASNADTIFEYLVGTMGLNNAAACGVLANIQCESNFNPNASGDYGTSYGICQWHNTRFTALKNYCSSNGYDYTTLIGQLHYLEYELTNSYSGVLSKLRSVSNTASGAYDAGYALSLIHI